MPIFGEKTIYYALATGSNGINGIVEANQFKTIGSGVIYIPENSPTTPVTISSAYVENYFRDRTTATGNNVNRTSVALVISGTKLAVSESNALTNTGENIGGIFGPLNFYNLFTGSFGTPFSSALSYSVETYYTQSGGTTTGMAGVNSLLGITYIYDTSAVTQSKSIIIPLYTRSGSAPIASVSASSIFAQIPVIMSSSEDYLVEASCSIVQYFLVLEGNTGLNASATDFSCSYKIDNSGSLGVTLPTVEAGLASDIWVRYIIPFPSESIPALDTTHSFNLWSSSASTQANLVAKLYITYHFIPSETTRYLNSYRFAMEFDSPITGGSIANSASCNIFERTITVSEPGPITLKNSAVELYLRTVASPSVSIRVTSQSANRIYDSIGSVVAGQFQLMHGITSGSFYGNAGITEQNALPSFSGGENPFKVYMYRNNVNNLTNVSGYGYINYLSGTSSLGIHTHTHTIEYTLTSMSYLATSEKGQEFRPRLVQFTGSQNWWLTAIGVENSYWDANAVNFLATDISIAPSESINLDNNFNVASGMRRLYGDLSIQDAELGYGKWIVRARTDFKRHPRDPDTDRLHPTGSRRWRTVTGATIRYGNKLFFTYHQITGSIDGTISNSNGGTINLKLFKTTTNELQDATTRSGDGTYSFVVYDPYSDYFVTAYEDNTYKGRSKNDVAGSGNFDISLTGGGAPTYTEHWF